MGRDAPARAEGRPRYAKVLVHPVAPVLNETRGMVVKYNAVLRRLVDKCPALTWLDFFDGFLDGDKLKPEYGLDGTHLHPRYLEELLAPRLGEAIDF